MDLKYPLRYENGAIALTSTNTSSIAHLLDTIAGERFLSPNFGVPLDILFSSGIPEILTERIRLLLLQYQIVADVSVLEYKSGTLTIEVTAEQSSLIATYGIP